MPTWMATVPSQQTGATVEVKGKFCVVTGLIDG